MKIQTIGLVWIHQDRTVMKCEHRSFSSFFVLSWEPPQETRLIMHNIKIVHCKNWYLFWCHSNSRSMALSCLDFVSNWYTNAFRKQHDVKNLLFRPSEFPTSCDQILCTRGPFFAFKTYFSLKFLASNDITLTKSMHIYFITDVQWLTILEE